MASLTTWCGQCKTFAQGSWGKYKVTPWYSWGNDVGHKWLGCISAGAIGRSTLDITYHLQAASRAFFANKQILCDKKVRLAVRLRFFDRVITPVALFASGHRTIRMSDLCKLDVVYRKMLRMIVGPPHFIEWNSPWHDIQHHWNGKAVALAQQHGLNTWSEQCLKHHWKFAMHVANLPSNRWVKRVLLWNPTGARTRGYPRHGWTSKFVAYTRFRQWGDWYNLAQDSALWMQLSDDFVKFCSTRWRFGLTLPAPQRGLPSDMQAQSQKVCVGLFGMQVSLIVMQWPPHARAARLGAQPTFVLLRTWMGTVEVAGCNVDGQWIWTTTTRRPGHIGWHRSLRNFRTEMSILRNPTLIHQRSSPATTLLRVTQHQHSTLKTRAKPSLETLSDAAP